MAINPIQFLVASNASILDGSKTISISGNVDCSRVYSGTAVFLGGTDNPAEAVSGTYPDGSGISTITLRNNWSQGDVSNQPLVSFNTNEGLAEAISNVREIVSNVSAIEDLATQGLIKRIDDNTYEVVSVTSLGESLVGSNDAGSARGVLGLGSAATKDVGTSNGNIMEVGSFGLGGTGKFISLTDWHQLGEYETGFYTSFQSAQNSVNNSPPITTSSTNYTIFVQRDGVRVKITAYVSKGVQAFTKTYTGSEWTDWFENYDSGNSVNPLDIGLGIKGISTDVDNFHRFRTVDAVVSGAYRYSSSTVGSPEDLDNNGTILYLSRATNDGTLLCTDRFGNLAVKGFDSSGDVSDHVWNKYYHSGNTNFNEFGGLNGDNIAVGVAVSSNTADFYFPLNSKVQATGITLSSATHFDVVTPNSNTIASGVAPSFSGRSSSRLGTCQVTGLSGITLGETLLLRINNNEASLSFNF